MWKKIKTYWEDYIVWNILYIPKRWYYYLRAWYRDCLKNPYYRKHLKKSIAHYRPWDSGYFIEEQYDWLDYAIYYYENTCKIIPQDTIDKIVREMKWAKKMLDIYLEKVELFKFEDDPNADKRLPIYMQTKHVCIPYVNLKNKNRFKYRVYDYHTGKIKYITSMYNDYPEELYKRKALHIYLTIINRYSENWWD